MFRNATLSLSLAFAVAGCATAPAMNDASPTMSRAALDAALDAAIANPGRSADNTARDAWRHPKQTLAFFGVQADQTVIEITPGGGWYAEILAPYLRDNGRYIAAVADPAAFEAGRQRDYYQKSRTELEARFAGAQGSLDRAAVVAFDPNAPSFGAPDSADVVMTFRNVHNWRMSGQAEGMFNGFFNVLRPGGVLGVVEHRANGDVADDDKSGYVGQAQVIALAQAAGFRLAGESEVNANPRDTKDHANGVWTLPPVKRHDAEDAQKYMAIGESDRMTLRFVKP